MTYLIVTSFFLLLFLAMIVVGFIRFRKPQSGWLLMIGFLGFGITVYFAQITFYSYRMHELETGGIISFAVFARIYKLLIAGLFVPALCPLILTITGFAGRSHPWSRRFKVVGLAALIASLWFVGTAAPSWIQEPAKIAESVVKSNIHGIQLALERYAVDYDGFYPESIETLIGEEYLTGFPINPFTSRPMGNVPYGSPDFEGNFTYLPLYYGNEVPGYYLIGYGHKTTPGLQFLNGNVDDHVVIELRSSDYDSLWPEDIPFPDAGSVIRSAVMTEF